MHGVTMKFNTRSVLDYIFATVSKTKKASLCLSE